MKGTPPPQADLQTLSGSLSSSTDRELRRRRLEERVELCRTNADAGDCGNQAARGVELDGELRLALQ